MTHNRNWIGVDVSKNSLDVFAPETGAFRLPNTDDGCRALADKIAALDTGGIVMEATGGYEKRLLCVLTQSGQRAAVVNPARVRAFATGTGQLAKTDRIDAAILSSYGAFQKPAATPLLSSARARLKEMLAFRAQIVAEITARSAQMKGYSAALLPRAEAALQALKSEKRTLEAELRQLIENETELARLQAILTSVPGVGLIVAATLLAELPELGTLSRRQIASLAGLAPFPRDSGQRKGYRAIRGGRADVRQVLFNAARVAARHNPKIRSFAERLAAKSKPYKVVIVAAMRKLLTILNAMAKARSTWAAA